VLLRGLKRAFSALSRVFSIYLAIGWVSTFTWGFSDMQYLRFFGAVPIDGNAFTLELVCKEIRFFHLLRRRVGREIDSFRYRIIAVMLKNRLHFYMPQGRDIKGGLKYVFIVGRNVFTLLDGAALSKAFY
jgi:hypothetical protein